MLKVFGAPDRYLQGPDAIDAMGPHLAPLGRHAVLVADRAVLDLIEQRVAAACHSAGITCVALEFSGEITPAEVAQLTDVARDNRPDFVIGAGGGKGIDAGKGAAHGVDVPVVTLPTAASNDAPTSKLYVLYDDSHRILRVEHMRANPALVVVDTRIISAAPAHLFSAGIGDAIVKSFEVAQCIGAGGNNLYGARATLAARALAELCYATLRAHAPAALRAVRQRQVNDDVERTVEATVLHSGLGFESGGLSVSHAMTRGLSAVRGARDALHGHQVAYGLLVQLMLEGRTREFIADIATFFHDTDLPCSLAQLGMADAVPAEIARIAQGTMTAAYIRNFQRELSEADIAGAITAVERAALAKTR